MNSSVQIKQKLQCQYTKQPNMAKKSKISLKKLKICFYSFFLYFKVNFGKIFKIFIEILICIRINILESRLYEK